MNRRNFIAGLLATTAAVPIARAVPYAPIDNRVVLDLETVASVECHILMPGDIVSWDASAGRLVKATVGKELFGVFTGADREGWMHFICHSESPDPEMYRRLYMQEPFPPPEEGNELRRLRKRLE